MLHSEIFFLNVSIHIYFVLHIGHTQFRFRAKFGVLKNIEFLTLVIVCAVSQESTLKNEMKGMKLLTLKQN